jgi:hypothetical protein
MARQRIISRNFILPALLCLTNMAFCQSADLGTLFKNPPGKYKPMPFWHLNGQLSDTIIDRQMNDVKNASGFGGVTVLPVTGGKVVGVSPAVIAPGMSPLYLSNDYFKYYGRILADAKKLDLNVVWYDDLDFPSGSAGGEF